MIKEYLYSGILALAALVGLYMIQGYSFLLFHCLAEGFSVVIAFGIFMMAWNTRNTVTINYLLFYGIAYLFIGGLDLVHTLIYKGMTVFHGYNANAATQFWIAARFLESLSLLLAPLWIGRKLPLKPIFWAFAGVFAFLLAAILSGKLFPDCYIDGRGLTAFKIVSEYIICLILLAALGFLYQKRQHIDAGMLRLLVLSIILTMASEIAFTFYVSVYALSNQIGHYLKIASFFLIYKAVIQTGLERPYDVLFRDLNQSRQNLKVAHDLLQQRVQERTADLLTTTEKLQAEIVERKEAQKELFQLNRLLKMLSECNQSLVRATDEKTFLSTLCRHIVEHGGYGMAWVVLTGRTPEQTFSLEALAGEDAGFVEKITMTKSGGPDPDDPIRTVLRTGQTLILQDIRSEGGGKDWIAAAAERGYTGVAILPLQRNGPTLGALAICSDHAEGFDLKPLELLTDLANDASLGIATLRTRRQQEVTEEERQLLVAAIDQASECIAIANSGAVIEYINQAVKRITGLDAEACIGQPVTALLPPDQDVPVQPILHDLKAGKAWRGRIKSQSINDSVLDLSVAISPIREPTRKIKYFVAIIRDISRECQMEHQLFQSRKMEAIGTLAGGVAHDFNNILSAILGYTELTTDIVGNNTMARENLMEVLKAGRRAKELVHQILAFSRRTMPECKPVSLKHIIEEAVKLLRSSLPSFIEIRLRLTSHGLVMADPAQMHQVVMNLCTNAAYAMRENGGLLELLLQDEIVDAEMAARCTEIQPGPFLKLIVSDTGCGIPQEILDHIFDPFFTTKAKNEGTGMGLSVVHGIVHACGGMISVSSEPHKGACFSILIPAIEHRDESTEAVEKPIPLGEKEHILLIDDEPSLVNMGRRVLTSLGYRVTTRTDGTEALNLVKAQPDRFDLVITDMTMPNITGDVLAREILDIRPGLPVIVCSGFTHKMDEHKANAMGIRAYIRKPVLRGEMARIIREVLGKKTTDTSLRKKENEYDPL